MYSNLKKEEPLSSLVLKNNVSKAADFILNKNSIDYKSTLMTIFESMKCEEIEELLSIIRYSDKNKYDALLKASKYLVVYNIPAKNYVYGFQTEIENSFNALYNDAKISLNTGDLVAFLLNRYFYYKKKRSQIIDPATNSLLKDIVLGLIKSKALLTVEINHQLYLPISKALFVFFLYDKKEGINKFKNIIRKDLYYKNTTLYELEYQETVNIFFDRLGLDYIPSIEIPPKQNDIVISEKKRYISKKELLDEIDKDDYFNKKIPLLNVAPEDLLIIDKNILNIKEFTHAISIIINHFYKNTYKLDFDLGKVFMENITNRYPKYSDYELIQTREILKEMFSKDDNFELYFFYYIYGQKEFKNIPGCVNKLPFLFSNYLGKLNRFSENSIKKYFLPSEKNPVFNPISEINDFIENITA